MSDDLLDRLLEPVDPAAPVVRPPKDAPSGLRWEWDGTSGHVDTPPLTERPTTWDEYLRDAGLDLDEVEVIEPVGVRGWDALRREPDGSNSVVKMHYYRLRVRRRSQTMRDLPVLLAEARRARRKPKTPPSDVPHSVTHVVWADPQTGKTARRGGTEALIQRHARYLEQLDTYLARVKPDAAMLLDGGDAIEGFENTPQQMGTNDLSIMDQVDIAGTLLLGFVDVLAKRLPSVGVRGVGSNHCRWRRGKDALGKPGDDWGTYLLKQLRKATLINPAAYGHVNVAWPGEWEETLAYEAAGYVVGLAHGHQVSRPDGIPDWWARQTHGGQPVASADILVTGHFHHMRIQPSGRNPVTNRSKWWVQAPTADNGSEWYRALRGDDSDPGVLVFTLRAGTDGYPFHELEVL